MACFFSQTYLIPQARKSAGITEEQVAIQDPSLALLIKAYCRESGVRNLQKHIEKVIVHTVRHEVERRHCADCVKLSYV